MFMSRRMVPRRFSQPRFSWCSASGRAGRPARSTGGNDRTLSGGDISSQTPGIIDQVLVERGDVVKKGQIVANLRAAVEKADVELAEAQVAFAKRKLGRNEQLFEQQHISANEKDEIETDMKKGEALLEEAKAKFEIRNIRSTVDGVVVKRELAAGEYVGEKPIVTIAQINPLNGEVVAPVRRYGSITRGMLAEVRSRSPGRRLVHGQGGHRGQGGRRGKRHLRHQGRVAEPEHDPAGGAEQLCTPVLNCMSFFQKEVVSIKGLSLGTSC